ncbi:MAG: metallophosphoesterase [Nitrososphaeria archaeon]
MFLPLKFEIKTRNNTLRRSNTRPPKGRMINRRQLFYISTASVLGLGFEIGYAETKRIEVTKLDVGIGRKIIFLADLHIGVLGHVAEEIIELVDEEEPDIIMLGGDTVDELTVDVKSALKSLSSLEAREKFAVMGNHEYWSGKAGELAENLKDQGFKVLYNSVVSSTAGKVYGLDWKEDRKYPQIKAEGIVIVHDPNAAMSVSGSALILAGHTHGGVVLFGLKYSNSVFTRGLYKIDGGGVLYVSRGLGQMFPWRLSSPLELVIIE